MEVFFRENWDTLFRFGNIGPYVGFLEITYIGPYNRLLEFPTYTELDFDSRLGSRNRFQIWVEKF